MSAMNASQDSDHKAPSVQGIDDHDAGASHPDALPSTSGVQELCHEGLTDHSIASGPIMTEVNSLDSARVVATELAQELSIDSLSRPAMREVQGQIQTVALQMDDVRTQVRQIEDEMSGLKEQTTQLLEAANALEQMFAQIDLLGEMVENAAAEVQRTNKMVEEAERELSTNVVLKPLQAMLGSLMGPKGWRG